MVTLLPLKSEKNVSVTSLQLQRHKQFVSVKKPLPLQRYKKVKKCPGNFVTLTLLSLRTNPFLTKGHNKKDGRIFGLAAEYFGHKKRKKSLNWLTKLAPIFSRYGNE
jgi:hypothetical protein